MRYLIVLCLFGLYACETTVEPEEATPVNVQQADSASAVEAQLPDTSIESGENAGDQPSSEENYPYLTDDNCVAFLTQYGKDNPQNRIKMTTPFGVIQLRLYDDTPLHRANFVYLINRGYFAPVEMTRVVKGFVVQGGNSESPRPSTLRTIIGSYTLPAEFHFHRVHKKGALSLSRVYDDERNPEKRSSPFDFFLVDGAKQGPLAIYRAEEQRGKRYSKEQVKTYEELGGTIHLDHEHTVFGEITSGMSILDNMTKVRTDDADWPRDRLEITIELVEN